MILLITMDNGNIFEVEFNDDRGFNSLTFDLMMKSTLRLESTDGPVCINTKHIEYITLKK